MLKKKFKLIFNNKKGFSLVEVLVALLLLSIISMTFLNVFLTSFDLSVRAQDITNYTYATQAYIEELRINDYRELVDYYLSHSSREEFDTNSDGTVDYHIELTIEPFGSCDRGAGCEEATYVHIIYFVDKALVVAGDSAAMYVDIRNETTLSLNVENGGTECLLIVNSNRIYFDRPSGSAPVVVMANLDLKDFGYNNELDVYGDVGDVDVKIYGNEIIVEEFISNTITPEKYCGIYNISTSLVKITLELFEESDSTDSFFEMSEIVEIYNGEKDSILGP